MALKKFVPYKINDKGPEIMKIAEMLKRHGSTIRPTQVYHIGMYAAVKKFQKDHKLAVTGIVDKKTYDKLMLPPPVYRKKK